MNSAAQRTNNYEYKVIRRTAVIMVMFTLIHHCYIIYGGINVQVMIESEKCGTQIEIEATHVHARANSIIRILHKKP